MTSNPPALQLYTVREQLAAGRGSTLRQIAAMGYRAVEPFNVLDDTDGLAADLAAAGLVACSVHAAPTDGQADAVIQAARTLGTDTVIVPYVPPAALAGPDGVATVAAELNAMAARLAPHGLRLGYHNHDFELTTIVRGRPALEVLADALDESVLLEVDTYWAAVGGQDVPALLGRLGDRVRYLHVKDGPVTKDDPMTAVGAGRMPVAEILAAGRAVEWHVVELDRCATDMMAAVAASLAFLAGSSGAPSAGTSTPGPSAAGEAGHG
jgi:sugar phosphate isomerase/epimerase